MNDRAILFSPLLASLLVLAFCGGPGAAAPPSDGASRPRQAVSDANGSWPMWGGTIHRNMVSPAKGLVGTFDPETGQNVLWTAKLGSQTYGNPVVAAGKLFIGSNNDAEYRPQHVGDRGCLLAFDVATGKFLWQLTRAKLPQGRAIDWPEVGICSTSCVEGDRLWLVTNRAEVMCLDTEGFLDGENDGPYQQETDREPQDADVVWSFDMLGELGVYPHNQATSSPVLYEEMVYLLTSNGVDDDDHVTVPAPQAPSFIALDKRTGKLLWQDNSPGKNILHGQWGSPAIGVVGGKAQVYFPGGDGWLYALDAKTGAHLWKFDLNPKDAVWEMGGRGTRNSIISTPVFVDNSVVLGSGQDPEHGEGVGHLYRIDATKSGDVTQSGRIWHYGGADDSGELIYRRTMSTVAVHEGLVYAPDLAGFLHCVDFQTGKPYWVADLLATVWGSPLVVDGKVIIGDEDGELSVFAAGREQKLLFETAFEASMYGTPIVAGGVLYVGTRNQLYAIGRR